MVESYLLGGIHASLYPWLQRQHGTKDQLLAQARGTATTSSAPSPAQLLTGDGRSPLPLLMWQVLDGMRFYTPSDVGLAPEFHCCVEEAAARLGRLASCTTPLEKLLCLKGASPERQWRAAGRWRAGVGPWHGIGVMTSLIKIYLNLRHLLMAWWRVGVAVSLFRSVQQHLRVHFPGEQLGDLQLATDDLVQLIAYTIIR